FYTRLSRQQPITGSTYCLPLTQAHIAAYLGLTVVHVNRVLRSLRDEQIVTLERHCMTILDLNRLNALAQKTLQPGAGFDAGSSTEPTPEGAADAQCREQRRQQASSSGSARPRQ